MMKPEKGSPVEATKTIGTETDILLKRIEILEREKQAYIDAAKRLLVTHEIALEEVEKLKGIIDARDDDQRMLHGEIDVLQRQNAALERIRAYKTREIDSLNIEQHNLQLRAGFLDQVIKKQDSIIRRQACEIERREAHFQELKNSRGWKMAKSLAKNSMNIPLVLDDLPEVMEDPVESAYREVPKIPAEPSLSEFASTYQKSRTLCLDWKGAIDTPISFAAPSVGRTVEVIGWCVDVHGRPAAEVWATRGGDRIPFANKLIRYELPADVDPSGKPENVHCGFKGEVATGPGENFIEVFARFEDGTLAVIGKRIVVNLGIENTPKRALDDAYQTWIDCFDSYTHSEVETMLSQCRTFELQPLISILLPVYNTEAKWLTQAIESVRSQLYENWELCIADDASPEPHVAELLKQYELLDPRIKVVYRKQNGHIAAATNSALEMASGEFCALLDHDDMLPNHALYYVVDAINQHPEAELIFSDEDKVDAEGRRFDPYFKSDWNLDLFLSHNCISHLGVYRTRILREINGFDETLSGSQDWDLALRFLLKIDAGKIHHIPRVLYHWRYLETSTSMSIDTKPYAVEAGKRAIEKFLKARGHTAEVSPGMSPGSYRVKYQLTSDPRASIIIPTRDQRAVTERCIQSILEKTTYENYEILLIDNQSSEPDMINYLNELQTSERVSVLPYDRPFNFSAINNFAARKASGEVLVFLNNDMEVIEAAWLEELVSQSIRPEIGAAGAWLLYPDHTVQHAGVLLGVGGIAVEAFKHQLEWNIGHMGRAHLNQNYSAVTGACLATRKTVFEQLSGFNEEDLAIAYNDVDYCLRLQRDLALLVTWTPYAKLYHHESISRGYEVSEEQMQRLEKESAYMTSQWAEVIQCDPYYNPNLTQFGTDFTLAWPPRVSHITENA
jgi:glycosyltransferase involved in cell wall biosynthesis